jgi:hypothetical protein
MTLDMELITEALRLIKEHNAAAEKAFDCIVGKLDSLSYRVCEIERLLQEKE